MVKKHITALVPFTGELPSVNIAAFAIKILQMEGETAGIEHALHES